MNDLNISPGFKGKRNSYVFKLYARVTVRQTSNYSNTTVRFANNNNKVKQPINLFRTVTHNRFVIEIGSYLDSVLYAICSTIRRFSRIPYLDSHERPSWKLTIRES